jgi:hypothetical protein
VLYGEARSGRPPIWVALENGAEIKRAPSVPRTSTLPHTSPLPKGALDAMKQAADTSDPIGMLSEDD